MAKKMNVFAKKSAELNAWASLLDTAQNQLRWAMVEKTDDEGNTVHDENGDVVRVVPDEDSYSYAEYYGWSKVVKTLESMKL